MSVARAAKASTIAAPASPASQPPPVDTDRALR